VQPLERDLRSHGRPLGDRRDPSTEAQAIDLLVQEVAYQHWHRMLFARWLPAWPARCCRRSSGRRRLSSS
jgi:hypothetical protein